MAAIVVAVGYAQDQEIAMSFQTPVTVGEILQGSHRKEYLLPAIQREIVWDADQARRLVDSLIRR